MSKMPFIPFYYNDFLGDTQDLDGIQQAAYLFCIFHLWQNGRSNEQQLKNICRTKFPQDLVQIDAKTLFESFEHKLTKDENGLYYSKRAEAEFAKSIEISEKRKIARSMRKPAKEKQESNTCTTLVEHLPVNTDTDTDSDTFKASKEPLNVREAHTLTREDGRSVYPDLENFVSFASMNFGHLGATENDWREMFAEISAGGWADTKGRPWLNWKSKLGYFAKDFLDQKKKNKDQGPMLNKHVSIDQMMRETEYLANKPIIKTSGALRL
jgi:uncharacterized protein YdaU (DUF1376 family)